MGERRCNKNWLSPKKKKRKEKKNCNVVEKGYEIHLVYSHLKKGHGFAYLISPKRQKKKLNNECVVHLTTAITMRRTIPKACGRELRTENSDLTMFR